MTNPEIKIIQVIKQIEQQGKCLNIISCFHTQQSVGKLSRPPPPPTADNDVGGFCLLLNLKA